MSQKTTLLFLHGVGDGDRERQWQTVLDASLQTAGYPSLASTYAVAPRYAHLLDGVDDDEKLPPMVIKAPARDLARQNRRDFERRIGALEYRIGRPDRGATRPAQDVLIGAALVIPHFQQARNYLSNAHIRAAVLNKVLNALPASGRLVIVAHSLGSVIAADVLRRLPVGLRVAGMVTIGSPLANANFSGSRLREDLKDPPSNLDWWVNFWKGPDPVVASRGLSSVFPWLLDYRIPARQMYGAPAHAAVDYLGHGAVAAAIGYAVFGSLSKELVAADSGVDVPLDAAETITLLALRYAHHLGLRMRGDHQERFAGARRAVQAEAVSELISQRSAALRPLPSAVARLAFDLSAPDAAPPEPLPVTTPGKEEAVVLLTVLAAQNVIRPFEITVSSDLRRDAMRDLAAEMALGSQFGDDVFAAAKEAQEVLGGGGQINWLKWGAIGAGAVALVVATGGLALAAGAGLAGAAALTSALAAFGPGGMIGGLLTAGALVTAGGGGIAFGLASPGTTAAALEAVVAGQLATAILRRKHDLEQDPAVWDTLADAEVEVRREYERLDEFSDEKAPGMRELHRKMVTLGRALDYLQRAGLAPGQAEFRTA
ncbi:hypothetical protein [Agrococcus sp. TSP3-2-1]|uniref:hypothetical protein n=1 Tax=Agrococcus sp. TSP3-2-1 TaxID=2804583 RepID=UPI003CF018F3